MSTTKLGDPKSFGVDTAAIDELGAASSIGVYEDLSSIVSFVRENGLFRSFNNMLYFTAANDLGQMTSCARQISKVLDVVNFILGDQVVGQNLSVKLLLLEEISHVNDAYGLVCSNLKVVYKVYTMRKPAVVVAITKILQSLVEYKNKNLISQLVDTFDTGNSAVQNILVPTKDDFDKGITNEKSMRSAFVEFWISICAASHPTTRKLLLTNFKLMNNFWKYLYMEKFESLNKIFHFLDRYVCAEPTFMRTTKCRIFNENFLQNTQLLFLLVKSENDRHDDNEDIHDFATFKSTFIPFMNTLVSSTEKGIRFPENDVGSLLMVNNVSFNVNNRLIYALLTAMKPWDSFAQSQFVLKILENNHELITPYMHYVVSHSGGYHDPVLSSYWIGHTLLYMEILKSKHIPPKPEYISLLPLSRNALAACITFPGDMVKQLGLQMILLQLQKLSEATPLSQSASDMVMSNLPPQTAFSSLVTHSNKLIKLTTTHILALFERLSPNSSSASIVGTIGAALSNLDSNPENCDSFDLLMLDMYLTIQSNNELKWWNKVGEKNSFFTSLLKFSNIPFLKGKISRILQKMTRSTLAFNSASAIVSPISVLVNVTASFKDITCLTNLWACLDETVSRAVSTPYKYLDKAHTNYNDLSIFLIVLLEQIRYINDLKTDPHILKWLEKLMTSMVVTGEPFSGLEQAILDTGIPIQLRLSNIKPSFPVTSRLEFAETVFALGRIVEEDTKPFKICDIMNSVGGYLVNSELTDSALLRFVVSPENWPFFSDLNTKTTSDSVTLATFLFGELLQRLDMDFTNSKLRTMMFSLCSNGAAKKTQVLLRKFVRILGDDQLKMLSHMEGNDSVVLEAYKTLINRNVSFEANLSTLAQMKTSDVKDILVHLTPSVEQINWMIENSKFTHILEKQTPDMKRCLLDASDLSDSLLYRIGPFYPEVAEKYRDRVIYLALKLSDWAKSVRLLAAYPSFFDRETVIEKVFSRKESQDKSCMNSSFVGLVNTLVPFPSNIPHVIRDWIHRTVLYITKKLAEATSISTEFYSFLESLQSIFKSHKNFLQVIPVKVLEAQLEVLLVHKKWSRQANILQYVNHVILALEPKSFVSDKLLQLFVNNEKNVLLDLPNESNIRSRFESALAVYSLFSARDTTSSTKQLLDRVLEFYLGSQRPEDLLLKEVLKMIEKNTSESWIHQVTHWDYQGELTEAEAELVGEERLFIKDSTSLVVALNKSFVKNTIKNRYEIRDVPNTRSYEAYEGFFLGSFSGSYLETAYDPEFLMLVIINNEELAKDEEGNICFDVRKLVDAELLRFVISQLASKKTQQIAKVILMGILKTLSNEAVPFRGKNILKIFISSIMHTLRANVSISPLIWHVIGSLCTVMSSPAHYMYERVCHYVLSTPIVRVNDIPLFHAIITCLRTEHSLDDTSFYKPLLWIIGQITDGIRNDDDIQLLVSKGSLESILNVCNTHYAPRHFRAKVLELLYSIQSISSGGPNTLITRSACLATFEVMKRSESNNAYAVKMNLNIDQLSLGLGIFKDRKRLNEWTTNDTRNSCKRIHAMV